MSYIDVLNAAADKATVASDRADTASLLIHDVANGTETATVTTANGEVLTVAHAVKNIQEDILTGAMAPILETQTLTASDQVNVVFQTINTNGVALYIEDINGNYHRYFNFTVDSNNSITLGETFPAGTDVVGIAQEIGGEVGTAVQQTDANAQLAEDWAILLGATVDGVEYSSKKYAQDSSASETNAASSASAASTSETNAATSETNAATSETNAATSASNASTSETNAASSASAASTSEGNAAASESAAATSASNASTSETNAATSASEALDARDQNIAANNIYADPAAGIAGTVDGEFFHSIATEVDGYITIYKNEAGVATEVTTYPSKIYFDRLAEINRQVSTRFTRSLMKLGDIGQSIHFDFNLQSFAIGNRAGLYVSY